MIKKKKIKEKEQKLKSTYIIYKDKQLKIQRVSKLS